MCPWNQIDRLRLPALVAAAVWVALVVAAGLAGAQPSEAALDDDAPRRQAEDDALEDLLRRLGMADLQILHLEQRLEEAQEPGRTRLARRLANLYAASLLDAQPDQAETLREKIQQLTRRIPTARTPGLDVVVRQASFQEAEQDALRWLNEGDEDARRRAGAALRKLAPELATHQAELAKRVEATERQLEQPQLPPDREEQLQEQLNADLLLMLRARFLAGWAGYYNGVLNRDQPSLQTARTMFRQLLNLDEEGAVSTAEWMGIDLPAKARSLIGLGMTEVALDDLSTAKDYFRLLGGPAVVPEIRDQAGLWHVRSLLNVGQRDEAETVAAAYVEAFDGKSTPGRAQLCATLVRAGFAAPNNDRDLGMLGIRGLARIGEFQLVRQLINKHDITLDNPDAFVTRWIVAQQALAAATDSKRLEDHQTAAAKFREALQSDVSDVSPQAVAQCRNEYAWCLYHARRFRNAGNEYLRAARDLAAVEEDKAAVKATWMAYVAFQNGSRDTPALQQQASRTLEELIRDYPDSEYARKAKYQLVKMGGATANALAELEKVDEKDPDYVNAKFDVCQLRHEQWRGARGTPDEPRETAGLIRAVDEFLAIDRAGAERKLRAALLGVEAAADGRPAQPQVVDRLLNSAAAWLDAKDDSLLASYHYHALRRSVATGAAAEARRHADWLRANPAGAKYERTALIIAAKSADAAVAKASPEQQPAQRQQALEIYQRLAELLGGAPDQLENNRNAQVATLKAAEYELELGRAAAAAARFDKLLQVAPKNRAFIHGAAAAHFEAGDYAESLGHWRNLVRAAKEGSDAWYEAKYHQIACLMRTSPQTAATVLQQFQLLHPDPPADWRPKFEGLAAEANAK